MKTKNHKTLVALNLPRSLGLFIAFVRAVILAMTGNKYFPAPSPTLATVDAAVSDLEKAQAAVAARVKGSVEPRDAKRAALAKLVDALGVHVQGVADSDPTNAAAIIQSAGFSTRKFNPHGKAVFAVTEGSASGSVKLVAPAAGHRASYDWQWSVDGGKTWELAPSSLGAKTVITGFAAGSTVSFRYRETTTGGSGPWSQAIVFLVR